MLGFVQNMMAPPAHPIGVDFGTDCLRMAQVRMDEGDFKLIAAASAEIPAPVRDDPRARLEFFTQTAIQLLRQAPFRGRRVVLGLPGSVLHIQQVVLPKMDEKDLKQAVLQATQRKLPFDASKAMLRHVVAAPPGRNDQAPQHVIAMCADSRWVNTFLAAAGNARLDVVAMNVQPLALIDCFVNVYRRTSEMESTRFYLDIGSSGTRALIARGSQLLFARNLMIGGDFLTRSVADAMGMSFHDAKTLRICTGQSDPRTGCLPAGTRNGLPRFPRGSPGLRRR
jgi:Tfp pilus assembly PilM family ATPase